MKKIKISEVVSFVPGINQTRAEKQFGTKDINYYDQSSFESDYAHEDGSVVESSSEMNNELLSLNEGDVVISHSMQLATIVGKSNVGKVLSLNFVKVEFLSNQLDKRYFLYLFNDHKDVKRQKERKLQGSGAVLRIPLKVLSEISIPMPPLEKQKSIGMSYTEMLRLQGKLTKYSELLEQFTGSIIEERLKEE
ncbi:restriction endonuclease subunit S [Vagococcus elongatus]|uniref:Restriction endonuclease subunit S n=1 Tax=Vagococcus elongatus TaxID=180344 RepID=A0A430ATE7_9ENTE|nr:restriction endonuclease subunit S [Vagococcus elongatus]RSU11328.1 restriction endonuclease subunit S [Vagococcus elongatus]